MPETEHRIVREHLEYAISVKTERLDAMMKRLGELQVQISVLETQISEGATAKKALREHLDSLGGPFILPTVNEVD